MAGKKRAIEAQSEEARRHKTRSAIDAKLANLQAGASGLLAEPVATFSSASIGAQAAWLSDTRLPGTQRQALAAQIARTQGNQHLQRVVASLKSQDSLPLTQEPTHVVQRVKSTILKGTSNERKGAMSALKIAERMVNKAQIRIGGRRRGRYKTWYDTNYSSTNATSETRFKNVKKGWIKIHSVFLSKRIYLDCSARNEGYYAEVDTSDGRYRIKLGKDFWSAPQTGRDSKGGAIVHEISHEELYTDDHEYGEPDAKQLAQNDPDKAAENADNWEYYAEDSY
jgi:hypothetical protein